MANKFATKTEQMIVSVEAIKRVNNYYQPKSTYYSFKYVSKKAGDYIEVCQRLHNQNDIELNHCTLYLKSNDIINVRDEEHYCHATIKFDKDKKYVIVSRHLL
jgi:hypothetical protein